MGDASGACVRKGARGAIGAVLGFWLAFAPLLPAQADCQDYVDRYRREYLMVTSSFDRSVRAVLEFRQAGLDAARRVLVSHREQLEQAVDLYTSSERTREDLAQLESALVAMGFPMRRPDFSREISRDLAVSAYAARLDASRGVSTRITINICMVTRSPALDAMPEGGAALDYLYFFNNSHVMPNSRGIGRGHDQHCDRIYLPSLEYAPFHSVFSSHRGRPNSDWRSSAVPAPRHTSDEYIHRRLRYGREAPRDCADAYRATVGFDLRTGRASASTDMTACQRQRHGLHDIYNFNRALFLQVARDVAEARTLAARDIVLQLRAERPTVRRLMGSAVGRECGPSLAERLGSDVGIPFGTDSLSEDLEGTGLVSSGNRVELVRDGRRCSVRVCQGYRYEGDDASFIRRETYPWERYIGTASSPSSGTDHCSLVDLTTFDIRYLWDEPSASGEDARAPRLDEAHFIDSSLSAACREELARPAADHTPPATGAEE